jgi:hypothetical protein
MGVEDAPEMWYGYPVVEHRGRLDDLVHMLPVFALQFFGEGLAANQFLQQVVRLPDASRSGSIPVGVVSRSYKLIQHSEVVAWLRAGLQEARLEEDLAQNRMCMSQYGERMMLWITLSGLDFDPGDGHPLRVVISCQNSVEGSCAMEIKVTQVRLVCTNGLVLGRQRKIRKIHTLQKLDHRQIVKQIGAFIDSLAVDQMVFSGWLRTKVHPEQIDSWINSVVAENWGKVDAARVASICRDGYDGKVQPVKDWPCSRWQVGWERQVPGVCSPVENIYHAAQALSWVASRHAHLEQRSERMDAIPNMIQTLNEAAFVMSSS